MTAAITFEITPNNVIRFSVLKPYSTSNTILEIIAPDGTQILFRDTTSLSGMSLPRPYSDSDPARVAEISLDTIKTFPEGYIKNSDGDNISLGWEAFPAGMYTLHFESEGFEVDDYFLEFGSTDICFYEMLKVYMKEICCSNCSDADLKKKIEQVTALRNGIELDFDLKLLDDMYKKIEVLEQICNGEFCGCANGC